MENLLISALLLSGLVCLIYFISQLTRLADGLTIVDMGDKRYDRNSHS